MKLEERKKLFEVKVWHAVGETFNEYSKELLRDFCDYWTEHNEQGRKMRFEKEKVFNIKRRLATWKRHSLQWNPIKEEKLPPYFSKNVWQTLRGDRLNEYKKLLLSLNWKYYSSATAVYWQSPEGKIIWL